MNFRTRVAVAAVAGIAVAGAIAPTVFAQVAGSTLLGVEYAELRDITTGWSAKRTILGQPVYNDKDERVGSAAGRCPVSQLKHVDGNS